MEVVWSQPGRRSRIKNGGEDFERNPGRVPKLVSARDLDVLLDVAKPIDARQLGIGGRMTARAFARTDHELTLLGRSGNTAEQSSSDAVNQGLRSPSRHRAVLRSASTDVRIGRRLRLVSQRRREPAFDEREGHVLAGVVVDDLIPSDAADGEVL